MSIETTFNGLGMSLGNLSLLSAARTRSISAENFDGSKGRGGMATEGTGAVAARELGQGWKVSPSIDIPGLGTVTLGGAANLHELELPTVLPGIKVITNPTNYDPIRQMQVAKFDSTTWVRFGDVTIGGGN